MTSPWDDRQKPHEKSPFHGKRDKDDGAHGGHGAKEHGLGVDIDREHMPPGLEKKVIEDPGADEEVPEAGSGGEILAGATAFGPKLTIPNRGPILDQDGTPRCVTYYSSKDQNQHDRPEMGRFVDFNEPLFAQRIGTTAQGASVTRANEERISRGFPVVSLGQAGKHKILRAISVDKTITAIKTALSRGHGVGFLLPWFHSWNHPRANGALPAPDYFIGYHMIFGGGWDDAIGWWLDNSWGTDYGVGGRCALPYGQTFRAVLVQRTVDA